MVFSHQLALKYILKRQFVFLKFFKKINFFFTFEKNVYYLFTHIKLSSFFYTPQLLDILTYDFPFYQNMTSFKSHISNLTKRVLIYNTYCVLLQQRLLILIIKSESDGIFKNIIFNRPNYSIFELFNNSNWLEREISELHGFKFYGKKDLRNLLLQYGDTSFPMIKTYPSVGTRDIYYDSLTDLLIQIPVTLQY